MTKCSFQYSVRTCTRRAQSFGLKECQLAFTERRTTDNIYMKIPPFDSLVLGSLRLSPIHFPNTKLGECSAFWCEREGVVWWTSVP